MNDPNNLNIDCFYKEEVTSTNDALAELCKKDAINKFTILFSDFQTAGKGQRGNSWESEYGKNLMFSIALFPTAMKANSQFILSMLVALGIYDTLKEYADGFSIKWPNDIYWKDKKICGVLIENEVEGAYITQSIVGIGLNINQEIFLSSAPNPVSLKQIIQQDSDRMDILKKIVHRIMSYYGEMEKEGTEGEAMIYAMYQLRQYRKTGAARYKDENGEFMAEFVRVEPDGHLILKDENGQIRKYAFKEVQYII